MYTRPTVTIISATGVCLLVAGYRGCVGVSIAWSGRPLGLAEPRDLPDDTRVSNLCSDEYEAEAIGWSSLRHVTSFDEAVVTFPLPTASEKSALRTERAYQFIWYRCVPNGCTAGSRQWGDGEDGGSDLDALEVEFRGLAEVAPPSGCNFSGIL